MPKNKIPARRSDDDIVSTSAQSSSQEEFPVSEATSLPSTGCNRLAVEACR
jgi:hypothetical protein